MNTQSAVKFCSLESPARLYALQSTNLLDSPARPEFDRVTRLVCRVLNTPVSLVTLVDVDRQFFVSQHGLCEPYRSTRQTPISYSLCRTMVETRRPLLIEDTATHPVSKDNPVVKALEIGSYAGAPLIQADGMVLGALCVLDHKPRVWTDSDIAVLTDAAEILVGEINSRVAAVSHTSWMTLAQDTQSVFRSFMSHCPALALIKDEAGRILYMNDAMQQHLLKAGAVAGDGSVSHFRANPDAAIAWSEKDAIESELGVKCDEMTTDSSGGFHFWHTTKFPIKDSAGRKMLGIISVNADHEGFQSTI